MELQVSRLIIFSLLAASVLAVPRKDCQLVRSSTGGGQCFSEPECEEVCRTVEDRQCQTNTEQVGEKEEEDEEEEEKEQGDKIDVPLWRT